MEKHLFTSTSPFNLESGITLPELEVAYTTWGKLNEKKDNVIWVCHALTANADAADWWKGLVGITDLFNPQEHFIVCANMLGSSNGSTSPISLSFRNKKPYHTDFPLITVRDIVSSLDLLRKYLGINQIHTCIGGSMGGQQAMEWAILQPSLIQNLILVATNAKHSAWGIAFNEAQRMAIKADSTWNKTDYYAGQAGLKAARAIAMLSYRNYEMYHQSQDEGDDAVLTDFKAASYQQYQGQKLADRFNVLCYLSLLNTMDSHNVGRGRGSIAKALQQIEAKTLVVGISSDELFPPQEQQFLAKHIPHATYKEIQSYYGHDGFLTETEKLTDLIIDFWQDSVEKKALLSTNHMITLPTTQKLKLKVG